MKTPITVTTQEAKQSAFSRLRKWLGSGLAPKLSFSAGSLAVAVALVFGISALVTTPLTAERVLAEAATAYEESPDGRYLYLKTKSINIIDGDEQVTIGESWTDTQSENLRSRSLTEDGTILNEHVQLDGIYYDNINEEALRAQYDNGDLPIPDIDVDMIIPGASSAGITFEDFETLAPSEIDRLLFDAGQDTYFDKIYGTTDFPGYTVSGDELDFNDYENLFPEAQAYYDGSQFVSVDDPFPNGGPDLNEAELEKESQIYEQLDQISTTNNSQERAELITKLQRSDNITLTEEKEWYDMRVVGIQHTISPFEGLQTTSVTYFDVATFKIAGSEHSSSSDGTENDNLFLPGGDFSFVSILLEESYSDVVPDFSTDGLEPIEFQGGYPEEGPIPVEPNGEIGN